MILIVILIVIFESQKQKIMMIFELLTYKYT